MDKKFQVFVSSTYTDLIEERNEVMKALLELDCIPSGMELFPSGDDSQWSYIHKVIDNCDYFIVISAGKYGTIANNGKSYTQLEYEYATNKNIPTIAFLHNDLDKLLLEKSEKIEKNKEKLLKFRTLLEKKLCRYWNNKNELSGLVSRSIVKLIKDKPTEGWVRASNIKLKDTDEQIAQIINNTNQLKDLLRSNTYIRSFDSIPKIRSEFRQIDKDKVELGVVGISYSQSQSGSYAIIFDNNLNNKRIPVVVGGFEAQAIAITLENLEPPRPLTHDLFKNFLDVIGFKVVEVLIDKHDDGVFFAIITFSDGLSSFELDSRLSDAIAIALRCKAPIFTFKQIINDVGITVNKKGKTVRKTPPSTRL